MADTSLRARSSTELVDAAIQLLRRHYTQLIMVSGIGMMPMLIVQPLLARMISNDAPASPELVLSNLGSFALLSMLSAIWFSLAGAVIIAAAAQGYVEGRVDVGTAIGVVAGRIVSVLVASFMKGVLVVIGFLLFIIGAFFTYTSFFAVPTTIVVEKLSAFRGLARSSELAPGHRGHIFLTMVLVWLLYFLISGGVGLLLGMFIGDASPILSNVLSGIVTILVYPVVPITEMLVYFDLRIRREGYDVEVMASQLDAGLTPAP
jgi:hypothetical protein